MRKPGDDNEIWIADDEPPPVEIVNAQGSGRAIVVCDHASARIPRGLGTLGLSAQDLERHVAWDIGAAGVARRLSAVLDVPLALSGYSRLVVDCNRPLHVDEAFVTTSEDVEVPGNAALDVDERGRRAATFYWPYHDALHSLVRARERAAAAPFMISVHSFTPVFHGVRRPWHVGVHYRWDDRGAKLVLDGLRGDGALHVGDNEPYPLALGEDYTVPVHAERRGMPYVLFEIRQDLIETRAGQRQWAERLGALLREVMNDPRVQSYGPAATDVRETRFE